MVLDPRRPGERGGARHGRACRRLAHRAPGAPAAARCSCRATGGPRRWSPTCARGRRCTRDWRWSSPGTPRRGGARRAARARSSGSPRAASGPPPGLRAPRPRCATSSRPRRGGRGRRSSRGGLQGGGACRREAERRMSAVGHGTLRAGVGATRRSPTARRRPWLHLAAFAALAGFCLGLLGELRGRRRRPPRSSAWWPSPCALGAVLIALGRAPLPRWPCTAGARWPAGGARPGARGDRPRGRGSVARPLGRLRRGARPRLRRASAASPGPTRASELWCA